MAIVLPQGRLNNTNDLFIRNFLFSKARILAVVGLHPNTFKPHTGTKTSVVFLQKYTDEELAYIREVQNRHIAEWENHHVEIRTLSKREELTEEDLPPLLMSFLQAEFEEDDTVELENNEETKNEETQTESDDELIEHIENLKAQLAAMPGRAKGKPHSKGHWQKQNASWRRVLSKVVLSIFLTMKKCFPAIERRGYQIEPQKNWTIRFSLQYLKRAGKTTAVNRFTRKMETAN